MYIQCAISEDWVCPTQLVLPLEISTKSPTFFLSLVSQSKTFACCFSWIASYFSLPLSVLFPTLTSPLRRPEAWPNTTLKSSSHFAASLIHFWLSEGWQRLNTLAALFTSFQSRMLGRSCSASALSPRGCQVALARAGWAMASALC